jgi:hypothetical protein
MTQNQCLPVQPLLQKEELHFVSVALSGNPGAARTLNLASSNTLALAVLPTTVSFNTTNWNIPQSILVSGISDANIIAEAVTITGSGVGLVSATTVVNTVDINTMSIILAGNPTSINEGGTANFTVKLGAEPTPSLVVSLASGTVGSVSLGTASQLLSTMYAPDQIVGAQHRQLQ